MTSTTHPLHSRSIGKGWTPLYKGMTTPAVAQSGSITVKLLFDLLLLVLVLVLGLQALRVSVDSCNFHSNHSQSRNRRPRGQPASKAEKKEWTISQRSLLSHAVHRPSGLLVTAVMHQHSSTRSPLPAPPHPLPLSSARHSLGPRSAIPADSRATTGHVTLTHVSSPHRPLFI